jgi:hypothetical protein
MQGLLYISTIVGLWKMFEKAGIAGWKAIIPIYSTYCKVKIANRSSLFFWLMIVPLIGLFLSVTVWGLVGFMAAVLGIPSDASVVAGATGGVAFVTALQSGLSRIIPLIIGTLVVGTGFMSLPLWVVLQYDTAKSYGKGIGTTFGLIFLPFIFTNILGFGDATYTKIMRTTE